MIFLLTSLLRMIWSLTHILILQRGGQGPTSISFAMFSLETLCFADLVTDIYSLYGGSSALSTINLMTGCNYGTFLIEWWTPMCLKMEPKSIAASECWTRQWRLFNLRQLVLPPYFICIECPLTKRMGSKDAFDSKCTSNYSIS